MRYLEGPTRPRSENVERALAPHPLPSFLPVTHILNLHTEKRERERERERERARERARERGSGGIIIIRTYLHLRLLLLLLTDRLSPTPSIAKSIGRRSLRYKQVSSFRMTPTLPPTLHCAPQRTTIFRPFLLRAQCREFPRGGGNIGKDRKNREIISEGWGGGEEGERFGSHGR